MQIGNDSGMMKGEMIEETIEDITEVVRGETTDVMEEDQKIVPGSGRDIVIGVARGTEGGVVIEIGMIGDVPTIIDEDERDEAPSHCKMIQPFEPRPRI